MEQNLENALRKPSFVFYLSFYEAFEMLELEEQVNLIENICLYEFYGREFQPMNRMVDVALTLIKPQLDANTEKRKNGEKGAEYGKLGGRPRKKTVDNEVETVGSNEKPHRGYDENPIGDISETPNVNENENVNGNVNVNVNVEREGVEERTTEPTSSRVEQLKALMAQTTDTLTKKWDR